MLGLIQDALLRGFKQHNTLTTLKLASGSNTLPAQSEIIGVLLTGGGVGMGLEKGKKQTMSKKMGSA